MGFFFCFFFLIGGVLAGFLCSAGEGGDEDKLTVLVPTSLMVLIKLSLVKQSESFLISFSRVTEVIIIWFEHDLFKVKIYTIQNACDHQQP